VKNVVLKPHAFVTGDIQAQSLSIERGAHFEGRSLRPDATNLRQVEAPASNGQGEPGVFAIGDIRAGSTKRVAAAVGEGAAVVAEIHSVLAAE
jgi:hypothetical protein